jgi:hypothetical protein
MNIGKCAKGIDLASFPPLPKEIDTGIIRIKAREVTEKIIGEIWRGQVAVTGAIRVHKIDIIFTLPVIAATP